MNKQLTQRLYEKFPSIYRLHNRGKFWLREGDGNHRASRGFLMNKGTCAKYQISYAFVQAHNIMVKFGLSTQGREDAQLQVRNRRKLRCVLPVAR
jgi:hypothetical protein